MSVESAPAALFVPSTMGTLDKLPLEIRREIYKYLLVNPVLGTDEALEEEWSDSEAAFGGNFVPRTRYRLTPAIIRTCRQVHSEASEILYSQVFIAHCFMDNTRPFTRDPNHCDTPISRYHCEEHLLTLPHDPVPSIRLLAMKKVRRWKVKVIDLRCGNELENSLMDFCKAVCQAEPKEIDVRILRSEVVFLEGRPLSTSQVLCPLTMLRNVGLFKMRNCWDPNAVPYAPDGEYSNVGICQGPGRMLTKMFKTLAESSRPVERLLEMNQLLRNLAQAFERYVPFKITMAVGHLEVYYTEVADALEIQGYDEFGHSYRNPYIQGSNDLEGSVGRAFECANRLETVGFKRQRERVVEQLQPIYRRIIVAAEHLDKFLERPDVFHSIDRRPPLPVTYNTQFYVGHLVVLIEKYAAAFNREQNIETQAAIRLQKKEFDRVYASMPREMLLEDLNRMLESENFVDFRKTVFAARKDMHSQLREIKEAWENLFNCDIYNERWCAADFGDCKVNLNDEDGSDRWRDRLVNGCRDAQMDESKALEEYSVEHMGEADDDADDEE
ncbi:hypothetical protein CJF32_00004473 [Rutstroemia sp. NJR-2017a WRK4]|nr:hypothetical protein CJF32_00004473 [Rutstroemia sp. NJR-2017a WRK4]